VRKLIAPYVAERLHWRRTRSESLAVLAFYWTLILLALAAAFWIGLLLVTLGGPPDVWINRGLLITLPAWATFALGVLSSMAVSVGNLLRRKSSDMVLWSQPILAARAWRYFTHRGPGPVARAPGSNPPPHADH
jgi:hypothetical protein